MTLFLDHQILGCEEFASIMQNEFEMSMMGELTYFLGLQIRQTSQGILAKFGMQDCKPISTPMSASSIIDKDEKGKSVDQKLYRGIIGSLLYLTASRPDIVFSVGICARYQVDPKESHLKATKRILRYIKGYENLGLFYPKSKTFEFTAYTDADYGGCKLIGRVQVEYATF